MPRDAVAITTAAVASTTATPAGVTINPTNGATIAALGDGSKCLVRVTNTNGSERAVTFKAGVNPPAMRKGVGDLELKVPATTGDVLICLETSRHAQADGTVNVDYESGMTGKLSAIAVPARPF